MFLRKMKRVKTMGRKYILYNSLAGNGKCMYDVQALADTYPDAILKKMTEIASYAEFMGSLANLKFELSITGSRVDRLPAYVSLSRHIIL